MAHFSLAKWDNPGNETESKIIILAFDGLRLMRFFKFEAAKRQLINSLFDWAPFKQRRGASRRAFVQSEFLVTFVDTKVTKEIDVKNVIL